MSPEKTYYIATGLSNVAAHQEAKIYFSGKTYQLGQQRIENGEWGHHEATTWRLTYDWTLEKDIEVNIKPAISIAEIAAVQEAWLLLMLLPGGRDTHTELGTALGFNKLIIIVGANHTDLPVFYLHPNVHHAQTLSGARLIAETLWHANNYSRY